jgi:hypothetical protein
MYISKWYQIKFVVNEEIEEESGEVHFYYDTLLVSGEMGEILKAIASGELFHIKPESVREIKQVYKNAIIFRD